MLQEKLLLDDDLGRAAALVVMSHKCIQDDRLFMSILQAYSTWTVEVRQYGAMALACMSARQVETFSSDLAKVLADKPDGMAIASLQPVLTQMDSTHAIELLVAFMKKGAIEVREITRVIASQREAGFMVQFKRALTDAGAMEGLRTITEFEKQHSGRSQNNSE